MKKYYKIDPKRIEYMGRRYFRVDPKFPDQVTQVVLSPGDGRRGRSNTIGVYLISRTTFMINYLGFDYAIPCSQKEYNRFLADVLKVIL